MSLPLLEFPSAGPDEVLHALREHGALLVRDVTLPATAAERALADADAFFDLPEPAKHALAIEHSPHFRGYSAMHNERDWREQVHFGCERDAGVGAAPHWRLRGPNQWPIDPPWRARMLAWLDATGGVGRRLLEKIAATLGLESQAWLGADPYLLMKCIAYHPQPAATTARSGVAAHLDFSLVTLTLQDDIGGLEVRHPDGTWVAVPCVPGAWLVNVGELLQYVTGNRLLATPHRVVNPSTRRRRISIPVFVNPSLDTTLVAQLPQVPGPTDSTGHVHAVLSPDAPPSRLPFGEGEWRRKGENVWCATCCR